MFFAPFTSVGICWYFILMTNQIASLPCVLMTQHVDWLESCVTWSGHFIDPLGHFVCLAGVCANPFLFSSWAPK